MEYNIEKTFCRNFRLWLEKHYPRQERLLAETLGISPAQINNIKHGRRAGTESWRRWVADQLGVDYNEMIEMGQSGEETQNAIIRAVGPEGVSPEETPGYRIVPLHESGALIRGFESPRLDKRSASSASLVISHSELQGRAGRDLRALRVTDDSMWPRMPEGSIVFVDLDDRRLVDDRLYVVCNPAADPPEAVIRRVRRVAQGQAAHGFILVSENQRFLPEMTELDWESLVIGRAIWVWRNAEGAQAEPQYQQTRKIESVEWLASGVAYQLNNVLSPIMGYGEMALSAASGNANLQNYIREMMDASVRAQALGRQLLAFSHQKIQEFSSVDLNEILHNAEHVLMRPMLPDNVTLRMDLAGSMKNVKADEGQVEQVLINIVNNALDAMPEGGEVKIETYVARLDEKDASKRPGVSPGLYSVLSVSDTGTGMDKDTLEHIFEPFFTTKTSDHSAGLGLSNTYGIVKQHGGNVWVYSEPGSGTTVDVYLPVAPEDIQAIPAGQEMARPAREAVSVQDVDETKPTILIVEDTRVVRYMCNSILEKRGYNVLSAQNGGEAMSILNRYQGGLDFLLTDVILPDFNGGEVYRFVSGRYPGVAVLFMSGYAKNVLLHHGMLRPKADFIQKPFSGTELVAQIEEIRQRAPE